MDKIYLARHAQAKSEEEDPERPLNDTGREQAEKVAGYLKTRGIAMEAIWHSGKARARQTAEILASSVQGNNPPVAREGLSPNDPVERVADEIESIPGPVMIVGHLPFIGRLARHLTVGGGPLAPDFEESAVACLRRDDKRRWRLDWLVSPGSINAAKGT
jgi:phosphohistidine phosphatase